MLIFDHFSFTFRLMDMFGKPENLAHMVIVLLIAYIDFNI